MAALIATQMQGLTSRLHGVLASAGHQLALSDFDRLQDSLSQSLGMERAALVLMSAMAALALVLIAAGLLALGANIVAQRTRALLRTISHGITGPVFPRLTEDLTASVGKLEKLLLLNEIRVRVFCGDNLEK